MTAHPEFSAAERRTTSDCRRAPSGHSPLLLCIALAALGCGSHSEKEQTSPDGGAVDNGPIGDLCGIAWRPQNPGSTAPANLVVERVNAYEVALSWTASSDPAVKRYRVMHRATEVGVVEKPSFVHRPVVAGQSYDYSVTALTDATESLPSACVHATIPAATPSALDALKAGEWYAIPNSHLADSPARASAKDYPWVAQGEGLSGIMSDWSSGALDTQRNRLFVTGGGHNGYYGNEIYAFDLHSLNWVRLTNPDPVMGECPDPKLGVNCATHTYSGLQYLPPPFDRFLEIGWDGQHQSVLNLDTNRWEAYPDLPQNGPRTGANSAYDPNTRVVWYRGGNQSMSYWDPASGTWTIRSAGMSGGYYHTTVVDPKRKLYVGIGSGDTNVVSIDALGKFEPKQTTLATTGDREIEDAACPGVEYDPVLDRIVAWKGGGDVYTLDLDTKVWTKHAAKGSVVPGPQNLNGTYGRFRYAPALNLFVVVSGVNEDVYVHRLHDEAPKLVESLAVKTSAAKLEVGLATKVETTANSVFRSLDPGVATVDADGTVHAIAPGFARIQAINTDPATRRGASGATVLEVVPMAADAVLDALTIERSLAIVTGTERVLRASATYHRGEVRYARELTSEITWSVAAPAIASVSSGKLKGLSTGSTTVTATLGDKSATAELGVVATANTPLLALNFQPAGEPLVKGWAVADESAFDATRGYGWEDIKEPLVTRGDRNGKNDPRLGSIVAGAATFRVQVPDGRYRIAASLGDNLWGSGMMALEWNGDGIYHVGAGTTAGQMNVEAKDGKGIALAFHGTITWLAIMPINGLSIDEALAAAQTW